MLWNLLPKYFKRTSCFLSKNATIETIETKSVRVRCHEAFKTQLQTILHSSSDLGCLTPPMCRHVIDLNNRINGNCFVCCVGLSHRKPCSIYWSFTGRLATMGGVWLLSSHHVGAHSMWGENSRWYQPFSHPTQQAGKDAILKWVLLFIQ